MPIDRDQIPGDPYLAPGVHQKDVEGVRAICAVCHCVLRDEEYDICKQCEKEAYNDKLKD